MENITRYRQIIHRLLADYHTYAGEMPQTDVDTEILCDDHNGQYMVMRIGWQGETRVHRPLLYLRLKDGKIRVEVDATRKGVANELMRAGVPASDLVLAFNPPEVKSRTAAFTAA